MSKKILITGASGLIGSVLSEDLSKNHSIVHLGRSKKTSGIPSFVWNVEKKQIDLSAFEGVDTIVHLAGANVGDKRWTKAWKKQILDSRVQSTALLLESLKNRPHSVKNFIAASAIGYYGFEGDSVFFEDNDAGSDFLAQVTRQWEAEVDKIQTLDIRVVKIRIGIVLTKQSGALSKMVLPINYGIGAALGSGNQNISWIHIDDLREIFIKAIEDDEMRGAYNATAGWVTNSAMTKSIAKILGKPLWMPNIPAFVLRIILGEMADVALNGSKVASDKILKTGFRFKFHQLNDALEDLLKK